MTVKPCVACGAPLGAGAFCEKCGADQGALAFDRDVARMQHSGPLRSARTSLLWVAGLTALGTIFMFAQDAGRDVVTLVAGLLTAAAYVGLWQWAKRQPLGAAATGLGIFVTLHVWNAVIDPATLLQGLIVKAIILVILIRGVRAGVVLRSHGVRAL